MRIGIDGNEANVENKVGVHQYAYEILWGIYREVSNTKDQVSNYKFVIYLKHEPREDLPPETKWWRYQVLSGGKVWIVTRLTPHLLSNQEIDVLFVPSHYAPPITNIPVVAVIHDLGYLESSEQFKKYDFWQLKLWTARTIYQSRSLVSVSQSTKNDLVRHYPRSESKIAVVHHGIDPKRFNTKISQKKVDLVKKQYGVEGDYILFLSMLKPSKNIEGLVDAYASLIKSSNGRFSNVKLVIAGKKGWLYESIFERVAELGLQKSVIFTDFVFESEKPSLYYGARIFVLPAFWEGFGMTALEAMACGTPVVASAVGGLPEVLGKVGVVVDPNNHEDIAKGLTKILKLSKKDYAKLSQKSLAQSQKFSWEKAARETLDVLMFT